MTPRQIADQIRATRELAACYAARFHAQYEAGTDGDDDWEKFREARRLRREADALEAKLNQAKEPNT